MKVLSERTYSDEHGTISLRVDDRHRAIAVLTGRATTEGSRRLVALIDEIQSELEQHIRISVLGDMRAVRGAPIRAQALLLKRLLSGKKRLDKAAFVIDNPLEVGVASTLLALAGMRAQARIYRDVGDALRFLGWPDDHYAP